MVNQVMCPVCAGLNASDAAACATCGTPFAAPSRRRPDDAEVADIPEAMDFAPAPPADSHPVAEHVGADSFAAAPAPPGGAPPSAPAPPLAVTEGSSFATAPANPVGRPADAPAAVTSAPGSDADAAFVPVTGGAPQETAPDAGGIGAAGGFETVPSVTSREVAATYGEEVATNDPGKASEAASGWGVREMTESDEWEHDLPPPSEAKPARAGRLGPAVIVLVILIIAVIVAGVVVAHRGH